MNHRKYSCLICCLMVCACFVTSGCAAFSKNKTDTESDDTYSSETVDQEEQDREQQIKEKFISDNQAEFFGIYFQYAADIVDQHNTETIYYLDCCYIKDIFYADQEKYAYISNWELDNADIFLKVSDDLYNRIKEMNLDSWDKTLIAFRYDDVKTSFSAISMDYSVTVDIDIRDTTEYHDMRDMMDGEWLLAPRTAIIGAMVDIVKQ